MKRHFSIGSAATPARTFRKHGARVLATMLLAALSHSTARAFTVEGESGLPYFLAGQSVVIKNAAPATRLKIVGARGETVREIAADKRGAAIIEKLPAGYYEARDGKETRSFAVTLPRKNKRSVVGLDAHISEIPAGDLRAQLAGHLLIARHSGASHLRDRFRWSRFQKSENAAWDDTVFRKYYQPQIEAGFDLLPAIEGLPEWAAAQPGALSGPPKPQAWRELFEKIAREYSQTIPRWQVWNEPNPAGISGARYPGGITARKYVDEFLKPAYEAAGKNVTLVLGGSAGLDLPWQRDLIAAGALNYVDFDFHPYGLKPFTFEPAMKKLLRVLDGADYKRPIDGTEFEVDGADAMAQMYVLWFSMDARMRRGALYKFDLRDLSLGGDTPPLRFGVANEDFSPKPQLAAMNLVAHRLAGATHSKTAIAGPDVSAQLIRESTGKLFATLYAQGEIGRRKTVSLQTGASQITLTDATGGAPRVVQTLGGIAVLPLPDDRLFYLDGVQKLTQVKDVAALFAEPSLTQTVAPQEVASTRSANSAREKVAKIAKPTAFVEMVFSNPLARPLQLEATLVPRGVLRFPNPRRVLKLRAGEVRREKFALSWRGALPLESQNIEVQLREVRDEKSAKNVASTRGAAKKNQNVKAARQIGKNRASNDAFSTTLPLDFVPQVAQRFTLEAQRDNANALRLLQVKVSGDAAQIETLTARVQSTDAAREYSLALKSEQNGEFSFASPEEFPTAERTPVALTVTLKNGLIYQETQWISAQQMTDIERDLRTRDFGSVLWMAQPFVPRSRTLSAVEILFNNWTPNDAPIKLQLREDAPDGKTIARAQAPVKVGPQNRIRFSFDSLLTDITPGRTYWLILEPTGSEEVRPIGGNAPTPADAARFSHEGAAWNAFDAPPTLSFRTLK